MAGQVRCSGASRLDHKGCGNDLVALPLDREGAAIRVSTLVAAPAATRPTAEPVIERLARDQHLVRLQRFLDEHGSIDLPLFECGRYLQGLQRHVKLRDCAPNLLARSLGSGNMSCLAG